MKIKSPIHLIFGHKPNGVNAPDEVSSFRRILPQFLAALAQHLQTCDAALVLSIPTLVIPAVIGISQKINPNEMLHMTADQASWLASISFIFQPFGSVLSGLIADRFGRKRAMLISNFLPLIGWILLATSDSPTKIYASFAFLGFGIGLMGSITYVSEISEPSVRGILMIFAGIVATIGICILYLLGSYLPWRNISFMCAALPIATIVVTLFLPETPIWLLSKKRNEEATKSLQFLRGWVSPNAVATEWNALRKISELSTSCIECKRHSIKCDHPPPGIMDKFNDMKRKRALKPFALMCFMSVFTQFSGVIPSSAYLVQVIEALGIAIDANLTTVIFGIIGFIAMMCLLSCVRMLGKRRIYLYSMLGNVLACFGLAIYGYVFFPSGWTSAETSATDGPSKKEIINNIVGNWNYFALIMFSVMQFFLSVGVVTIPFFLSDEIFPFKSRSFYSSLVGILNQLLAFVATKTYYDSEKLLSLSGVFCFYAILGAIGYVLMYFILPETEHRSLQDIELHYSDNKKGLFDIEIRINGADAVATAAGHGDGDNNNGPGMRY